jgi:hypothetical protein
VAELLLVGDAKTDEGELVTLQVLWQVPALVSQFIRQPA